MPKKYRPQNIRSLEQEYERVFIRKPDRDTPESLEELEPGLEIRRELPEFSPLEAPML